MIIYKLVEIISYSNQPLPLRLPNLQISRNYKLFKLSITSSKSPDLQISRNYKLFKQAGCNTLDLNLQISRNYKLFKLFTIQHRYRIYKLVEIISYSNLAIYPIPQRSTN